MAALVVLIGAALTLLALGAIGRVAPHRIPLLQAAVCGIALLAALCGPGVAVLELRAVFGVDGLSATILAALFLLGACGAAGPVLLGTVALAVLAGDALSLFAAVAIAILAAPATRRRGLPASLLACLVAALLLHAWHESLPVIRFAAIRAVPPDGLRAALILAATLATATLLPLVLPAVTGGLLGLYLLARLLLDLPGPVTPGWWGVPPLLLGLGAAVVMARRAGSAEQLDIAVTAAGSATLGLAASGIGIALLARGADLLPLAALAVAASLLLVLAWSVWGGLLLLASNTMQASTGTTHLARLGGLLRRMPITGMALLVGLAAMAALPLTAGFGGLWLLLQAVLGASRLGSVFLLALAAGGVSALGLAVALLAAAAIRLAGTALLGVPRSAAAAAATEPSGPGRVGITTLALTTLVLGICPWLGLAAVQPAVRQLTGIPTEGAGPWMLASAAEAPGYAPAPLLLLLAAGTGLAAWIGRGPTTTAALPWRGGLAEDGPARANTQPLLPWPQWRSWRPQLSATAVLGTLALALAATLGWAAR